MHFLRGALLKDLRGTVMCKFSVTFAAQLSNPQMWQLPCSTSSKALSEAFSTVVALSRFEAVLFSASTSSSSSIPVKFRHIVATFKVSEKVAFPMQQSSNISRTSTCCLLAGVLVGDLAVRIVGCFTSSGSCEHTGGFGAKVVCSNSRGSRDCRLVLDGSFVFALVGPHQIPRASWNFNFSPGEPTAPCRKR